MSVEADVDLAKKTMEIMRKRRNAILKVGQDNMIDERECLEAVAVLDEKIEEMTRKIGVLEDLDRNRKEIQKRFQDGQKKNRLKTLALLKEVGIVLDHQQPPADVTNRREPEDVENQEPEQDDGLLPLLSKDEFEKVPAYMKGRIPKEAINEIITKMNEMYDYKKSMLTNKNLTAMADKVKASDWKKEIKTVRALVPDAREFVTEKEIHQNLNDKGKAIYRKCLPILRHTKRVKERKIGSNNFVIAL